jgi:hypothetical protein
VRLLGRLGCAALADCPDWENTWSMGVRPEFRISLDELEATTHVDPADLVESVDAKEEPLADTRGPQPDRDWFAAGG